MNKQDKLENFIKARFPYIFIETYEEDRVVKFVNEVILNKLKNKREILIWSSASGLKHNNNAISNTKSSSQVLEFIKKYEQDAIFILFDFEVFSSSRHNSSDNETIRALRDLIPDIKNSEQRKTVIFVSPELNIPLTLQKDIVICDFCLPDLAQIRDRLDKMIAINTKIDSSQLSEEDKDKLCKAALGLTLQEVENAFALAMVNDGKLTLDDIQVVLEEKMQVIRKTGLLEYIQTDVNINDIGGLDNLKKWLLKRNNSWSERAKKYCIPSPKGVLITGIPGCGKSLCAKAMGAIWKLPLLRLDLGKIFSGIVGSSEENIRKAIKTVEAVAPSILWVDEIEKGLGNIGSSNDGGVTSRIFGTFLTWMQEKTTPVFVIATANNISRLPAELLRKGRFDEIFFVDLPTFNERREIFALHLQKRLKNSEVCQNIKPDDINLINYLAQQTEGFIGSEIEQVVISALCDAFFENRPLDFRDLDKAISNTVPLSQTQKEQIIALREWANIRAVSASSGQDNQNYSNTVQNMDISMSRGGRRLDI